MYSCKILCLLAVLSSGGGYCGSPVDTVPVLPDISRSLTSANFTRLRGNFDRRYEKFQTLEREFTEKLSCEAFLNTVARANSTEGIWHQPCYIIFQITDRLVSIRIRLGMISRSTRRAFDILETGISSIGFPRNQSEDPDTLRYDYKEISYDMLDLSLKLIEILDVWLDMLYNITSDKYKSQDAVDMGEIAKLNQILANPPKIGWWLWERPDQRVVNTTTEAESQIVSTRAARYDFMKMIFNLTDQVRNDCSTLLEECIKENQEVIPRFFAFVMHETDKRLHFNDSRNFTAEAFPVVPVVSRTPMLANFTTLPKNFEQRYKKFQTIHFHFQREEWKILDDSKEHVYSPRDTDQLTFERAMLLLSKQLEENHFRLSRIFRNVRRASSILDESIPNVDYAISQLVARYVLPIDYDTTLYDVKRVTSDLTQMLDDEASSVYDITVDQCKTQDAVEAADTERLDQILFNASRPGADQRAVHNATVEKSLRISRRARRNDFQKTVFNLVNQLKIDCSTIRDECHKDGELIPEFYRFVLNEYGVGAYLNSSIKL